MTDLATLLKAVMKRAAECGLLGSLAADRDKREEYRARAKFYDNAADELRALIESSSQGMAEAPPPMDAREMLQHRLADGTPTAQSKSVSAAR